jgi:hypothetical protein
MPTIHTGSRRCLSDWGPNGDEFILNFGWIGNLGIHPGCHNGGKLRFPQSSNILASRFAVPFGGRNSWCGK